MESIEIQGTSIEAAAQAASTKLGVDRERIKVTVLEEAKGLFGKASVRIKAEVLPEDGAAAKPKPAKKAPAKSAKPEKAEAAARSKPEKAEKTEKPPAKPARGVKARAEPSSEEDTESEEGRPDAVASDSDADVAIEIVEEILNLAKLVGEVRLKELNGRYVNLELDGKDVAYLVGKHGEVLNAFQYLVNVMMARRQANGVRVTLDGNHYRERREAALSKLAQQIAEQVRERGEEAVLDALPAFERRVVHKALQDTEGVQTYSEGEEPNRRIVIAPG